MLRPLFLAVALCTPATLEAATFHVTVLTDTLPDGAAGELRTAINSANAAAGADTITIDTSGTITLAGPLPLINSDVTITGLGAASTTVSGANLYRVFFIRSGTVVFTDMTIANGNAKGGNGANATWAGGGGAGMGGGVLLNSGSLTLTNVAFSGNTAIGGTGGTGGSPSSLTSGAGGGAGGDAGATQAAGGGGGGLYGKGGDGGPSSGFGSPGGGGGGGVFGTGGTGADGAGSAAGGNGTGSAGGAGGTGNGGAPGSAGPDGGASGNAGGGGLGGAGGGGGIGASGAQGGFGGGGGGAGDGAGSITAGAGAGGGGDYGGGGSTLDDGRPGGYGGGGAGGVHAATGGTGGFGGGGGAGYLSAFTHAGPGGTFAGGGGVSASAASGGGGAGLGGAIFLRAGSLTLSGCSFTSNTASGGAGGGGSAGNGQGKGGAIFLSAGTSFAHGTSTYASNAAANDANTPEDNDDIYGGAPVLSYVAGDAQDGTAGLAFATQLQVKLTAATDSGFAGSTIAFTGPGSEPNATFATSATTNSMGIASVTATAGHLAGGYSVTAGYQSQTVPFALTNIAGAPSAMVFAQQPSATDAGAPIAPAVTVSIRDQYDNETTSTASVALSAIGPAGFTQASVTNVAAVAGLATFDALSFDKPGTYVLNASSSGLPDKLSQSFTLSVGLPAAFLISGASQQLIVTQSAAMPLAVTVVDAGGNPVANQAVIFTAPSSGATSMLSAPTLTDALGATSVTAQANGEVGAYEVQATLNGLMATFPLSNVKVPTSITLTPSATSVPFTGSLSLTAALSAAMLATAATGAIVFRVDDADQPASALDASFSANFAPTGLGVGAHTISASYPGDAIYASSTASVQVEVSDALPVFAPVASLSAHAGESVTAMVSATDSDPNDTLTYSLTSGPSELTLSGNTLTFAPTTLAPGDYTAVLHVADAAGLGTDLTLTLTVLATDGAAQRSGCSCHQQDDASSLLGMMLVAAALLRCRTALGPSSRRGQ